MIKIASFNVRNDIINRKNKNTINEEEKVDFISKMLIDKSFDLFGMQELTFQYFKELSLKLRNYKFYGKYRYGNLLKKMPYNENNNIMTGMKVLMAQTIWLPWIPSRLKDLILSIKKKAIIPRIATIIVVKDRNNGNLCMINTHLSGKIASIQIRQLMKLKEIIMKYSDNYSVILTGDFNMQISDKRFSDFVSDLKKHGLKHVKVEESTWKNSDGREKSFDHIFIPENWIVEKVGVIDLDSASDHKIIFVEANNTN